MVHALIEQMLRTRDPQILVSLVPQFQRRAYKKGEALLDQGDSWGNAFFIERVMVKIHFTGPDGRDFSALIRTSRSPCSGSTDAPSCPACQGTSGLRDFERQRFVAPLARARRA